MVAHIEPHLLWANAGRRFPVDVEIDDPIFGHMIWARGQDRLER